MSTVIAFPEGRRERPGRGRRAAVEAAAGKAVAGSAQIVILPVVRIERHAEPEPSAKAARGRKAGERMA